MSLLTQNRIEFEQALAALLAQYGDGSGTGTGTILESRLSLINYAKVKLDEIIPEGEGVQFSVEGDINISDPLNIMLNSLLDEAAKRVLMNCPLNYLEPVVSNITTGTPEAADNKIGYVILPDNFLRLVSFKMAEWSRAVSTTLKVTDKKYATQRNKYTRGKTQKPQVALSHRTSSGDSKRVLEYYSVDESHSIDWFYYIQETKAEDVQQNLVDALTWVVAGMVLQITERVDLAKVAFEQEQACYHNL